MTAVPVTPPITEYLYRKATAAGTPLSGTFELTPVCNMDCKMCYVRLSRQAQEAISPLRSGKEWLKLGQAAKDAGMLYLLLTGGEPLLHPDFREIMEGLHRMGLLITVNSNGTLIDENTVAWLKNAPPMRFNISLYGTSDATYDRLCGNPKGFTQVKRAIKLLRDAGISVKLNCSLTPYNALELPEMVKFAKDNGLVVQVATYMFPPVRKDGEMTGKNDRFTPAEAAFYMAYADYLTLGKGKFLSQNAPALPDPDMACADLGDGIRCRAGRCSFWVTWQGDLTPCGMFPCQGSPNVFQMPFGDAWEAVKAYTESIRLPGKCAACPTKNTCRACGAMVITESGCFDRVPQYRCDMMAAYPAQLQRVKEGILCKKQNMEEF